MHTHTHMHTHTPTHIHLHTQIHTCTHTYTVTNIINFYTSSSINFLRLCQIVLEDVPSVLRDFFQLQFNLQNKHQWTNSPQSGQLLMHYERWCSKLSATQVQLLQNGDINQWDLTLIFHVLLYSSWCLLVKKIQGTQFTFQIQSKTVKALAARIDLRNFLGSGDKIIVDLHSDPFRAEIRSVTQNQFSMQYPFKFPKGYQGQAQTQITVDVYVCQG